MANIRSVEDIYTQEDLDYLESIVEITENNKQTLRDNTRYSEQEIVNMCEHMQKFMFVERVVDRLDNELNEARRLIKIAKQKYEKNNKTANKELEEYLRLAKKIKSLEAEKDFYSDELLNLEEKAVEYDRIVNEALDRQEARENKNDIGGPSRPKK